MAKHHQFRLCKKLVGKLLIVLLIGISISASAQNTEKTNSNIQYDLMLMDIMEQAHRKESGVDRYPQNRFIILPHQFQGQILEIKLDKETEKPSTLIYEVHDMNGKKIMEGILPQDNLVDISSLKNKLHVVTLRSVDNLMKFNLVVD